APAAVRILERPERPRRVPKRRTLPIEPTFVQVEQQLKSCAAWYFSPFLNSRCTLLTPVRELATPTAAMKTTTVETTTTAKARPPARREAAHITAVIKSTERA